VAVIDMGAFWNHNPVTSMTEHSPQRTSSDHVCVCARQSAVIESMKRGLAQREGWLLLGTCAVASVLGVDGAGRVLVPRTIELNYSPPPQTTRQTEQSTTTSYNVIESEGGGMYLQCHR
jgi:hypothetical protein